MIPISVQDRITQLLETLNYELYDVVLVRENNEQILRLSITHRDNLKEPITLEDCQKVSLLISPLLDVELPQMEDYFLEVSSPGIERNLKTIKHFKGAIGEFIKVKLQDKSELKGVLQEVRELPNGACEVVVNDTPIALENIKKAQTYFQWKAKG